MVDMTPALNAALAIRESVQAEIDWINTMLEVQQTLTSLEAEYVASHLVVIKTALEAQDALIAMLLRSVVQDNDFLEDLKKKMGF